VAAGAGSKIGSSLRNAIFPKFKSNSPFNYDDYFLLWGFIKLHTLILRIILILITEGLDFLSTFAVF